MCHLNFKKQITAYAVTCVKEEKLCVFCPHIWQGKCRRPWQRGGTRKGDVGSIKGETKPSALARSLSFSCFFFLCSLSHVTGLGSLRTYATGYAKESQAIGILVLEKRKHNQNPIQTQVLLRKCWKGLCCKLELNLGSATYSHGHLGQAT